jgi:hypothetical protein
MSYVLSHEPGFEAQEEWLTQVVLWTRPGNWERELGML